MPDSNTLLFELDGHVAKITLNRPEVYNSFNREMALALQARLDQCRGARDGARLDECAGQAHTGRVDKRGTLSA